MSTTNDTTSTQSATTTSPITNTVKLYQILNSQQLPDPTQQQSPKNQSPFSKLLDQSYLPIKTRYSLLRDVKKITSELEDFNKLNQELIIKYASSDGVIYPNTPEMNLYLLAKSELLDIDVELKTDKINIDLFLVDECTLSTKEFLILDWIINDNSKE